MKTRIFVVTLIVVSLAFMMTASASAQTLEQRVTALEAENQVQQAWIDAMIGWIATQQGYINTQQDYIRDLQAKLTHMSVVNGEINGLAGPHVIFTGANLHIRSGSGSTDDGGSLTGLGNLVVGYNEDQIIMPFGRGGSHNLVVGLEHEYSSYGGFVAGKSNDVTSASASVSGGERNIASGNRSSVSGGYDNTASGIWASVSGGYYNTASNYYSSVSGGFWNTASGRRSSVSGGRLNTASNYYSSVSGGYDNTASGENSSVSGGNTRSVSGIDDWRAGSLFEDF